MTRKSPHPIPPLRELIDTELPAAEVTAGRCRRQKTLGALPEHELFDDTIQLVEQALKGAA